MTALPRLQYTAPLLSRGSRVATQRRARRARFQRTARAPVSPSLRDHDPLRRPRRKALVRALLAVAAAIAAVAGHGLLLALAFALSGVINGARPKPARREKIEIAVVERAAPAPDKALDEAEAAAPRPKPAPAPTPKQAEPPPPDPSSAPPEAPPLDATAPRRIVGLSLGSTVVGGGGGPTFAVGNTRMGDTASRAEDPASVEDLPPGSNRVSSRAPQAGVRFEPPVKVTTVTPEYPPTLKAQAIEGDVILRVDVRADGGVARAVVVKTSGYPELDDAARHAAQAERWRPASRDGTAVADIVTFTVRFRLTDS